MCTSQTTITNDVQLGPEVCGQSNQEVTTCRLLALSQGISQKYCITKKMSHCPNTY